MINPYQMLIVCGVMMLAHGAIVSYWFVKFTTPWRHFHWFGKVAIFVLALMAANQGRQPFETVQPAVNVAQTIGPPVMLTAPDELSKAIMGVFLDQYAIEKNKESGRGM